MEAPKAMRNVDPSSVFAKSLALLGHNLGLFPLIALVANAPALAYRIATAMPRDMTDPAVARAALKVMSIEAGLGVVAHAIAGAAISYGVLRALAGEEVSLGQCLRRGLSRALPVLGLGLVTGMLVGLGACACVLPGLYLAAMLFVAIPAVMAEDLGMGAALKRSQDLTKGARWPLVGLFVMIVVVNVMVLGVIVALTHDPVYSQMGGTRAGQIALGLASVPLSTLQIIASAVAYHTLTRAGDKDDPPSSAYF